MTVEALSALIDGECTPEELDRLLDALERDPELARRFSRGRLAQDAREGVRVLKGQPCICAGVMDAVRREAPPQRQPASRVVALPPRRPAARVWKPLIGLAAAASMGALAVLLVRPESRSLPAPAGSSVSLPDPGAGPLLSVSADPALVQAWPRSDDASARQLRSFLIDHSSAMAEEGVGGTLRYARFAAHTADLRAVAADGGVR